MEEISGLMWSCLICVVAKELYNEAVYTFIGSFSNTERFGWTGSLLSHCRILSVWSFLIAYDLAAFIILYSFISVAVEVHILAHQSEADESAPLGTTLLGEAPATLVPTLSTNCARETSPGYPWV